MMENIKHIIDYISVSVVPIAALIISLLNYLNDCKKKDVGNEIAHEVSQQSIHGNNYYYEDNITYEISTNLTELRVKQQKLSERQQNIEDTCKFLTKYSYIYLFLIYLLAVFKLLLPLPQLSLIPSSPEQQSILVFGTITFYRALIPTMINLLTLIGLMCLILVFKSFSVAKNVVRFISSFSFFVISVIYFICRIAVSKIPLDLITMNGSNGQPLPLPNFLDNILPFIFALMTIPCWLIAHTLIKVLFETEQTKPNFKLLRTSIPRSLFYLVLFLFPSLVTFFCQYIS